MVTWADGGEVEEMVTPPSLDSLLFFWGKTFRKPAKAVEHEVEPSRLALFCDAYVGVVATLLYLPLMSLLEDEGEPEVDLESKGNVGLFTMKWLRAWTSFLMILVVYIAHSNVLYFLKGYDITILVLTLLSLLAIGLIPFTVSLSQLGSEIGEVYPTEIDLSVFLFLAVMIFCIWIQAWRKRDHLMWKKISYPEWRYLAFRIGCFILAILITIGLTFLFYFPQLGILLIQYLLIRIFCFFFPILDHLKEKKENENESTEPTETEPILQEEDKKTKRKKHFRKKLDHFGRAAGGMVHRERYIILTDAIYAFSATLIVADLQLSDFETSEVLHSKQLWAILSDKLPEIVGYLWCFVALAVFWTLHDRCFSCIFKVTSGVVLSASLGLSVVPTMAFGCKSSMISVFGEAPFPSVALMFVNGTQTIISLSYFFMYVVVSTRPDIIKPSHYHIFAHSTSKTRFWHLETILSLLIIFIPSFIGIFIALVSIIGSFVCAVLPLPLCLALWWKVRFLNVVDKANLTETQQHHHEMAKMSCARVEMMEEGSLSLNESLSLSLLHEEKGHSHSTPSILSPSGDYGMLEEQEEEEEEQESYF